MQVDKIQEGIEMSCGKPPRPPVDWYKIQPGKFELTEIQKQQPMFVALAKLVWKAKRGYLIDWLWRIFDTYKANEELHYWEKQLEKKKRREAMEAVNV
jgi:hypothetical protein